MCGILTACEEHCGDDVGGMGIESQCAGTCRAREVFAVVDLHHGLRIRLEDVPYHIVGEEYARGNGLSASHDKVYGGGFLVAAEIAREGNEDGAGLLRNYLGYLLRGYGHHVHAHGIAGEELNPCVNAGSDDEAGNIGELSVRSRRLGGGFEFVAVRLNPADYIHGVSDGLRRKNGRSCHAVALNPHIGAARLRDCLTAAVNRGDECAFGRRKRNIEFAGGVFAVDLQFTRDTQRDLNRAYHILAVFLCRPLRRH